MDGSQQQDHSTWSTAEDKNRALSRSNSPHPLPQPQYHDPVSSSLTIDPALASVNPYSVSDPAATGPDEPLTFTTPYLSETTQGPGLFLPTSVPQPDSSFNQGQGYSNTFQESFVAQLKSQGDDFSSLLNSDFSMYPTDNNNQNANFNNFGLIFDPQQQQDQQHLVGNQSINPADLSRMSSPHNPTSPPHLVPPDAVPSPRAASPASTTGAYYTPQHSRHASLDPVTAAYMTSQQQQSSDWQGLLGNTSFQGHRRAPSEHSDVSSVSHSPYLAQHESFDAVDGAHSPLLIPQNDPSVYGNAFGMESFSISDPNQHQGFSPAHSPYISPRLTPKHQHQSELPAENSFLLAQHANTQIGPGPSDSYVPHIDISPHPTIHSQHSPGDIGHTTQMAPPSINVEFAPPSRTSSFGPQHDLYNDTLSPPSSKNHLVCPLQVIGVC